LDHKNQQVEFATEQENKSKGIVADYILGADGKLVRNPNANPAGSPDGKIHIQVDNGTSLQAAQQAARQLQIAAVNEKIAYWQRDHKGDTNIPDFLKNELFGAQTAAGVTPATDQAAPQQVNWPGVENQPPAPPDITQTAGDGPVGTGPGSYGPTGEGPAYSGGPPAFANHGGFNDQGYFQGNGNPQHDGFVNMPNYDGQGQPLTGGEKVAAKEIYDYLLQNKLTENAACGILGNMMTESSLRTDAVNHSEGAVGLCQWEKSRLTDLKAFAAGEGKPITDWKVQVDFMLHELHKPEYAKALNAIQNAQSPAEAAYAFDRWFEKSAGTSRGQRQANAENIAREMKTGPLVA
jgi:hypothetical protein